MVEQLLENVDGMTENKAEGLTEEYVNLYTLCWATIYDQDHMHQEYKIKPDFLRDQLQEDGLYRSYFGKDLYVPDRVPEHKVDRPLEGYGRYDHTVDDPYRKSEKLDEHPLSEDRN